MKRNRDSMPRSQIAMVERKRERLSPAKRLQEIRDTIDFVELRCMAADGEVSDTRDEITIPELQRIYIMAGGKIG